MEYIKNIPLFIAHLKGLRSKKMWKEMFLLAKMSHYSVHSGSQRKIVSWISADDPSSSQPYQKVFGKNGSPQPKYLHPKPQHVNLFSVKLIYTFVMYDESFFTIEGNEWRNSKVIMSLKITQQQEMSNLFTRLSSQRRFSCEWVWCKWTSILQVPPRCQ
jgi:hypothetical protein